MRVLRILAVGLLTLCAADALAAELRNCPAGDRWCYERNIESACTVEGTTVASCLDWIRVLEQHAGEGAKGASLMIGVAYSWMAARDDQSPDAAAFRARATAIYEDLIARDGADAEAILALAGVTEDKAAKIRLLRKGVALTPTDIFTIRSLARELQQSGRSEDVLEAAEYMERAYSLQSGLNKGHLASQAYRLYQESGSAERAARFRARVRKDLGMPPLTHVAADADPDAVAKVLDALCNDYGLPALGGQDCLQSIGAVIGHLLTADPDARSQKLADIAVTAMMRAAGTGPTLGEAHADWESTYLTWMDSLLARGFRSPTVVNAHEKWKLGVRSIVVD